MKYSLFLFLFFCNCSYYIVEVGRQNNDECKKIIREKIHRNLQYKKVYFKIKKECKKEIKRKDKVW